MAFDADSDRLLVTGKNLAKLYDIKWIKIRSVLGNSWSLFFIE
ncbi:MAG: hypothetical protein JW902_12300 [Syntrophaceae bacterium]|nr:hypothetical protein [Syntrophaceae bacterium]